MVSIKSDFSNFVQVLIFCLSYFITNVTQYFPFPGDLWVFHTNSSPHNLSEAASLDWRSGRQPQPCSKLATRDSTLERADSLGTSHIQRANKALQRGVICASFIKIAHHMTYLKVLA